MTTFHEGGGAELVRDIAPIFDRIRAAYVEHMQETAHILAGYRSPSEEAALEARKALMAADARLAEAVNGEHIPKLRKAIQAQIARPLPEGFADILRQFDSFGVRLTRAELEALSPQAAGNFAALKLLEAVARKSGFTIKSPSVDDFEKEIRRIFVKVPTMYAPAECASEAVKLLPDVPVFADDGSTYSRGTRPSLEYLFIQASERQCLLADLTQIADRWGRAFVPSVDRFFTPEEIAEFERHFTRRMTHV